MGMRNPFPHSPSQAAYLPSWQALVADDASLLVVASLFVGDDVVDMAVDCEHQNEKYCETVDEIALPMAFVMVVSIQSVAS